MNGLQYVECKFRENDARSYTYHWDTDHPDNLPMLPGDKVKLPDRRGGWSPGIVVAVRYGNPPRFETKAIIGRVEPEKPEAGPLFSETTARDIDEDVQSLMDRDRE